MTTTTTTSHNSYTINCAACGVIRNDADKFSYTWVVGGSQIAICHPCKYKGREPQFISVQVCECGRKGAADAVCVGYYIDRDGREPLFDVWR